MELVGISQQDLIDKSLLVSCDCLQEHLKEEGQSWYVTSMMEYLKQSDDGFDYRICKKFDGGPCGVIWVTSAMRYNWEQYGFCLFLDAMKRDLNNFKWPYISVVVIDSYEKVRCCCEAIVSSERIDAYK